MAKADSASNPLSLTTQQAAAQIVALINSRPHSPRPEEIEAIVARAASSSGVAPLVSPMAADWWRAIRDERDTFARHQQEYKALRASGLDLTEEDAKRSDAEAKAILARTEEATVAVWQAGAKTWADIVLFAELARYWMWDPEDPILDKDFEACLEIHDTSLDTQSVAQLVNAILCAPGLPPATSMSAAHAGLYGEWRGLIETHMREFEPGRHVDGGYTEAVKAEEERMGAHMALVDTVADKILTEPVQTWGDLLSCAEVAFWYQWPGVNPHGSDARGQMDAGPMNGGKATDDAVTKVLKGIFSLAGIGQFAPAEVRP
jgi:hypothetical protein